MKIGLLLPSALMYEPLSDGKIFAPKDLFLDLAKGLVRRGHKVRVYASSDEALQGFDVITGEMGYLVSEPSLMKHRYIAEKTKRMLARIYARWEYEMDLTSLAYTDARQGNIELVHSFLEFSGHYFAKVTGIPTVYTVHDPVANPQYLDYFRYLRFPNDPYVAISRFQASELKKIVHVTDVVYNGLDPARSVFSDLAGEYLLFVGRYMPEKGVEDAVKTGIETKTLTILAGSKEYRQLPYFQKTIQPYAASGYMKDVGFMNAKQKNGLFGGAKALLAPIHWDEPFGMVMIEAMACGTPVIAYNRGSVPEIVKDGVTGFIVEPDDNTTNTTNITNQTNTTNKGGKWIIKKRGIEGLVEAVKRIGEIDRAACRRHVEENFTVEKMVEGYEKVYERLIRH
ncbi:glycosyltransferase [Candidatus Gottesmanbacteria bacterium]|nr:glycosyltransferase [Candidatus Gottesmanbacteria bacterium]